MKLKDKLKTLANAATTIGMVGLAGCGSGERTTPQVSLDTISTNLPGVELETLETLMQYEPFDSQLMLTPEQRLGENREATEILENFLRQNESLPDSLVEERVYEALSDSLGPRNVYLIDLELDHRGFHQDVCRNRDLLMLFLSFQQPWLLKLSYLMHNLERL